MERSFRKPFDASKAGNGKDFAWFLKRDVRGQHMEDLNRKREHLEQWFKQEGITTNALFAALGYRDQYEQACNDILLSQEKPQINSSGSRFPWKNETHTFSKKGVSQYAEAIHRLENLKSEIDRGKDALLFILSKEKFGRSLTENCFHVLEQIYDLWNRKIDEVNESFRGYERLNLPMQKDEYREFVHSSMGEIQELIKQKNENKWVFKLLRDKLEKFRQRTVDQLGSLIVLQTIACDNLVRARVARIRTLEEQLWKAGSFVVENRELLKKYRQEEAFKGWYSYLENVFTHVKSANAYLSGKIYSDNESAEACLGKVSKDIERCISEVSRKVDNASKDVDKFWKVDEYLQNLLHSEAKKAYELFEAVDSIMKRKKKIEQELESLKELASVDSSYQSKLSQLKEKATDLMKDLSFFSANQELSVFFAKQQRKIEGISLPDANQAMLLSLGMRQKWAILLDSVDLAQVQNCQVDLTHALEKRLGSDHTTWEKLQEQVKEMIEEIEAKIEFFDVFASINSIQWDKNFYDNLKKVSQKINNISTYKGDNTIGRYIHKIKRFEYELRICAEKSINCSNKRLKDFIEKWQEDTARYIEAYENIPRRMEEIILFQKETDNEINYKYNDNIDEFIKEMYKDIKMHKEVKKGKIVPKILICLGKEDRLIFDNEEKKQIISTLHKIESFVDKKIKNDEKRNNDAKELLRCIQTDSKKFGECNAKYIVDLLEASYDAIVMRQLTSDSEQDLKAYRKLLEKSKKALADLEVLETQESVLDENITYQPNKDRIKQIADYLREKYQLNDPKAVSLIKDFAFLKAILADQKFCDSAGMRLQKHLNETSQSLEAFLLENLQQLGFEKIVPIIDLLGADTFQGYLHEGILMKDAGVKYTHGPYTHLYQLWLISEALKECPEYKGRLLELYQALGDPQFRRNFMKRDGTKMIFTIWDDVFDVISDEGQEVVSEEIDVADISERKRCKIAGYCCPEYTVHHIINDFPDGRLKEEFMDMFSKQIHFGGKIIFPEEASNLIINRIVDKEKKHQPIMPNYLFKIERLLGKAELEKKDDRYWEQRREELSTLSLPQLENIYHPLKIVNLGYSYIMVDHVKN